MGKTPGKWIKTLLLGKKSPKSNSANGSEKLSSAKKEEAVVSVRDGFSNLSLDPPLVSSQPDSATTPPPQNVDESKVNLESRNDTEDLELQHAVIKVQAAFRAHQARRAFRTLKAIIRLQAVIRGHLVRRQAVATYSCIWGIVKFQALVRGRKARSSDNGIQLKAGDSEALQLSTYKWMDNPSKLFFVDKLLASSPTALPLKIQYGPEEPNSAKVWLERWTQLQVWSPGSGAARILVPKPKTKKRSYEAVVETEKARPKRGVKKQSGPARGNGAKRSTTEIEKPKRNVRKASTLSKDPLRTESDKGKQNARKSRSASKEGSPSEAKDDKPRLGLKRSSLSNGSEKAIRKSAEKKKYTVDSVKIEPEVKVSGVLEGGDAVQSAEKEKNTADSVTIEPEAKVSDVLEGGDAVESAEKEKNTADSVQIEPEAKVSDVLEEGHTVECDEKETDTTDVVPKEFDVEKEENSPEEGEPIAAETGDKGEDLKCSDAKVSSENGCIGSDSRKSSERRVSLHANNDDGITHSGRKIPSYMAPTASAKARVKGEGSPMFAQEKNGTLRRLSLPSPANGKLSSTATTTMSPGAHRLLLASAKGSINGDKSFSSSKNISDKSNRTKWKR
uniref:Protein IQ-DOMAIN 31 n=1 Tax=Noccaea caerulescens TaxID=107243 RepID=A0A1J3IB83_NOCCA